MAEVVKGGAGEPDRAGLAARVRKLYEGSDLLGIPVRFDESVPQGMGELVDPDGRPQAAFSLTDRVAKVGDVTLDEAIADAAIAAPQYPMNPWAVVTQPWFHEGVELLHRVQRAGLPDRQLCWLIPLGMREAIGVPDLPLELYGLPVVAGPVARPYLAFRLEGA